MDEYNDNPYQTTEVVVDDPKKPWKAYVPTVASAVALFVMAWVTDEDPFTAKEAAAAAIASLTTSGLIGMATYLTPNPKVTKSV